MDTSSESWRHECEIRWCAAQDSEARTAYYADVLKHRGKPVVNELIAAVNAARREKTSKGTGDAEGKKLDAGRDREGEGIQQRRESGIVDCAEA